MRFSSAGLIALLALSSLSYAAPSRGSLQDAETPLKIKRKPTASPRGCSGSGKAVLKVTFDRSGKVTGTNLLRPSGCDAFDKSALDAARKIRFEPATRNGEPITVTRALEYTFSIY